MLYEFIAMLVRISFWRANPYPSPRPSPNPDPNLTLALYPSPDPDPTPPLTRRANPTHGNFGVTEEVVPVPGALSQVLNDLPLTPNS